MDIKLKKKPWYIRYRYYLLAGGAFVIFLIYVISLSLGPRKLRVESDNIQIAEVRNGKFMEYVDVEGLVQPILTIKVNTREAGSVERIVTEEGSMMKKGDTILVLTNPDLLREIEDQRDEWENQRYSYKEREIEMEQKSLTLKQQALQTQYEMSRLQKSFGLEKEEYKMGIKSKAQLEVSEDEYNYNLKKTALQMESLKHDSAMTVVRKDLLRNELERGQKKFLRSMDRLEGLIVRAPIAGQLSYVNATPGQQVASNSNIAEIKVLDQFKIHTQLSEYYIDRITTGLPATVNYQGKKYPLKITKVVPEVKDRMFDVDLVFTGEMPENVRVGKSFRVQIELGQPEDALVMPRGNFYQATGGQWIYKVNTSKDKAVRVPLTIGRQNPQQYEITEGLQDGDLVIVTGYDTFGEAEELILK
ncbi:MAG: efflux RND transporter periplasmic adaptor subunit [Bacteroidaceae bacterium]|nr:efflux RND transporter periplasmic adaptor subunit [Bacteroidaceae bacterium]